MQDHILRQLYTYMYCNATQRKLLNQGNTGFLSSSYFAKRIDVANCKFVVILQLWFK